MRAVVTKTLKTQNSADGTPGFLGEDCDDSNLPCSDEDNLHCALGEVSLMILSAPMMELTPVGHWPTTTCIAIIMLCLT